MKKSIPAYILVGILLSLHLSACSAITGIFKAGMSVGVFISVIVVIVIIVIIMRSARK